MMNGDVNRKDGTVLLREYELNLARLVGMTRVSESRNRGLRNGAGLNVTVEEDMELNVLGAAGEMAVAKYLNQYWGGTVNTFHCVADVGFDVEVRTTKNDNQGLIIRPRDDDFKYFFLVWQQSETKYVVKGFLLGKDAKHDEYLKNPNNRIPAYFVPVKYLIKLRDKPLRDRGLII